MLKFKSLGEIIDGKYVQQRLFVFHNCAIVVYHAEIVMCLCCAVVLGDGPPEPAGTDGHPGGLGQWGDAETPSGGAYQADRAHPRTAQVTIATCQLLQLASLTQNKCKPHCQVFVLQYSFIIHL